MRALLRKIRQILKDRKTRRIFTRLVSTVAAIVVFVTTYALVLPAITMESEAACGIEAHQHDQSCYTDVLVCKIPENPGHVHDESCYSTKQKQVCQIEEHVHDSDCYDESGELICEKTEHQHGEDCFEEVRELVCEIPESSGHQHDDSCYQKVLTCGKEVHTHSAACYHVETASKTATEAIAVASTESAAAATRIDLVDNLNAPAENSEPETSPDSSIENSVIEGNLDASLDNSEPGSGLNLLTDEVSSDEPGAWTSTEATADVTAGTAASTGSGAGAAGSTASAAGSTTGATAATTASANATDTMSAAAGYVPVLDELDFKTLLNKHTGIYYSRLAGTDSDVDNETDGADAAANTGEAQAQESDAAANISGTQVQEAQGADAETNKDKAQAQDSNTEANTGEMQAPESANTVIKTDEAQEEAAAENTGELQEVATWNRTDKHTELKESDNLRLYLAYTIPAGSLNETNQTARYSLPQNIHLTDEQVDEINATVNGIAGQYVSYDTLEILDQEMYGKYLGNEAVEGTRTPADDLDEYLANNEGQEFISATVKVENVFDENTGLLKAQDLVFTFAPYTIQKNQHQYDSEGKPTKAGEEVNGWLAIDISTEQIDWENADNETKTADIIFVEKDKKSDLKEISTKLRLVETEVDSDVSTKKATDAESTDSMDSAATDNKQDGTKDSEAADGELDKETEKEPVSYPSVSFDDSITVAGGSLSTDTDEAAGDAGMAAETEITVHVEADKDTFPEGTTMVLSAVSDDQMTAVAEAVEGAVDAPKTMGFHAVDISFRDVKGNEIEPLKPIRVSMTSDAIRRAVQDESTAPVVVHVSDPSADQEAVDEDTDDGDGRSTVAADADEAEGADSQYIVDSSESTEEQVPGSNLETTPSVNIIETDTGTKENNGDTLIFDAEAFSVYAIVYTVDFHWEVDGKEYEFSIPGGGFASFEHLVEVLGIVVSDENNETNEIQKFVNNVDNIVFSNQELVSVSKIEEDTTVGAIKENLGLERVYSAELTEEEIADINAQVIRTGDWVLISLKPFDTEESLTITMKSGDQWIIKVTDAQKTSTNELQQGDRYVIYIIKNGNYYALNSNGETYRVPNNDLDSLTSDYLWTYNNQENGTSHYAGSATWENGNNFLDVYWSMENPDPEYYWVNKYYPLSPTSKGWQPIVKMMPNGNNGFYFYDVNDYGRYLVNSNDNHVRTIEWNSYINWYHSYPPSPVSIYIYKQGSAYTVKAQPNNSGFGRVEYTHNNSTVQTSDENPFIEIQTVSTEEANKTVPDNIVAVPAEGYLFDGWTVVKEDWETVQVIDWGQGHNEFSETIKPIVDGNITLQAKFRPERQYHFTVRVNDDTMGTVGYEEDENTIVENLSIFESESNAVINDRSDNMYKITTNRKPMYKFLHWELRDAGGQVVRTYDASSLDPGEVELSEDGMELVAVYARKKDNEIDNIDINDFLDEWQETMVNDFTGVDKTASVHDPANRIFEIDLTASSAKWEMERSLSLDFITDTSRSMFFPANLEYAKDTLAASTTTDLKSWLEDNGVSGDVYYVISNDDSATVFALFKEGNKWYYLDSSYYYYEESGAFSGTAQKREVPNGLYFAQTGGTNSGTAKTMTGIVYVSSDATDTYVSHQDSSIGQVYWSRLDYLYKAVEVATTTLKAIDPSASISLTTFNANSKREGDLPDNKEDIYAKLRRISPKGGTRQDRGLLSSYNGYNYTGSSNTATETGKEASEYGSAFSQGSEKKQVAILISDGAPNFGNSTTLGWDDIITQADLLKGVTDSRGENLTLMTLGLSLNFVHPDDLANFKGLATEGADGGYAINANSGAEIVESIKTLIKSLVDKADLHGTATDTLDPAFYPVMADGTPIENGSCFTTPADATDCCDSMHYIGKIPPSGNTPYLQWTKDGEVWTVTYYNQTFGWAETDTNGNVIEPGWKKAFYAKAKEDFLGGNTIETNGEASVTADKCIVHGTTVPRDLNESIEKTMESPHVNVKDLMFVGNDTKWTVYIESEVTPIEQIRELYKNIKVLEVVSESTDRMITDKDAMLYDQGTGNLIDGKTPEAFYLEDIIPLEDDDWTSILENGSVEKPYSLYGHDTGNIRISLTKTGNHADYDAHNTSSVLVDKEEYVLTVQYIPNSVETMVENDPDGGRYHTTKGGSSGNEIRNGRPCNNTHLIDLFVKGFSITKTSEEFKTALPGAGFSLYHLATEEEIAMQDGKLYEIEGEQYYPEELSFDESGVAFKNGIRANGATTKYYLVETKAPEGYILREEPIQVMLVITNSYTLMPAPEGNTPVTQETKPESGLYNWEEKASLTLAEDSGIIRTTGAYNPDDPETDLTHTGVEPTSLYEVMYYRISNNPGFELPSTGGPGTKALYLIGTLLTGLAGAGLLMRRKRRRVA